MRRSQGRSIGVAISELNTLVKRMVEVTKKFRIVHNPDISYEMSLQDVLNRPLNDINLFIGYLKEHHPELTDTFVSSLQPKLRELVEGANINIEVFQTNPENISDYPELEIDYKKAVLHLLQYDKYSSKVSNGKGTFLYKDFLRSWLIPAAHIAETTVKLLSREEGLEFYRNYVDYRTDHEKLVEPMNSLDDIFDSLKSDESPLGGVIISVKDGPLYVKITSCLWKETLKAFDPEIRYAVLCHFDFHATKHYNENFVLTRKGTLAKGNRFCDFCWQDRRFVTRDHPDDDFWEYLS
ncbi:MAG: L-2-amino-thiazoline-4-carboxylic acid hydrolase [Candidatus Thorarchaeota archaeon]|jgi:hypothetical protein